MMRKRTVKRAAKRTAAAILAGCMLLGGCSGQQSADTGTSAGGETVQAGDEEVDKSSWVSEEPVEISIMMTDNANQPLKQDAPSHQEIFKKTNVKLNIQIVPGNGYNEKKSIVLGTNNFPDIIYTIIGCCVDFHHIHAASRQNLLTQTALVAWFAFRSGMQAVDGTGKDLRRRCFSCTSCAAKQIRMRHPSCFHLIF